MKDLYKAQTGIPGKFLWISLFGNFGRQNSVNRSDIITEFKSTMP